MDALQAEEAMMQGQARVEKFKREFMQKWTARKDTRKVKAIWASTPQELRDQFAQQQPDAYRKLMNELKEK